MQTKENMTRINQIKEIISYKNVSNKRLDELNAYEWDYESTPALLNAKDIVHVLELYLEQKITATDIEKWADFLECRDDVHADKSIADLLFELANPDTEGELTKARAQTILLELQE